MRGGAGARAGRALAAVAMAIAAMTAAPRAGAGEASGGRIEAAAEEFDVGRRAYLAGNYAEAAIHFENAFHDAPRPESLRGAIHARRAAHDDARAATLASLASIRYGTDAATLKLANDTLADLSPRLLGVTLGCEPACGVAADGRVVSLDDAKQIVFYVTPGKHELLVSWPGDRTKRVALDGAAGAVRDMDLTAPPLPAPAPEVVASVPAKPASDAAPAPVPAPPRARPLGPAVFAVGAGLTALGVAATIVSGVAAQNDPGKDAVLRDCVGQGESCPTFQRGKSAELRTNIALGATAGLGLATAVIGVFFTRWSKAPPSNAARVAPAHIALSPYATVAPGGASFGVGGAF